MRLLHAFSFAALSALSNCALATEQDAGEELRAANSRYDAALVAADEPALDALYRSDFTYIGPGGVMRSKAEQIETLTSGRVDLIEGRSDEVTVRIYGETAVLTGRFTGKARVSDDEFSFHERYSTVWVREGDRWLLALEHGTVIKDELASYARVGGTRLAGHHAQAEMLLERVEVAIAVQ